MFNLLFGFVNVEIHSQAYFSFNLPLDENDEEAKKTAMPGPIYVILVLEK